MAHIFKMTDLMIGLALALGAVGPNVSAFEFSKSEYEYIHDTAKKISDQFPSQEYFYVGVGRSPTPIITYLQLDDIHSAGHLPATKLKWATNVELLSDEHKELLRDHLIRFLPSKEELSGRKILLIDHVESGLGLMRIRHYVKSLLGEDYPVVTLGLVFKLFDYKELKEMVDHKIVHRNMDQIKIFASERYDEFAAYDPAIVFPSELDKLKDLKANPNYAVMVKAVVHARKKYSPCDEGLTAWKGKVDEVIERALSK